MIYYTAFVATVGSQPLRLRCQETVVERIRRRKRKEEENEGDRKRNTQGRNDEKKGKREAGERGMLRGGRGQGTGHPFMAHSIPL